MFRVNTSSMSRLRQFVAVYLAVVLAVAGATGLSPLLHQLIEHGGHGVPHLHHGNSRALAVERDNPEASGAQRGVVRVRLKGSATQGHQPFTLPKASLLWLHHLSHWLVDHTKESVPDDSSDASGHQHHSLAQTLASGLIEAPASAELSLSVAPGILRDNPRVPDRVSAHELDRQTAGRAPPASRG
jgi:hypothetical protein